MLTYTFASSALDKRFCFNMMYNLGSIKINSILKIFVLYMYSTLSVIHIYTDACTPAADEYKYGCILHYIRQIREGIMFKLRCSKKQKVCAGAVLFERRLVVGCAEIGLINKWRTRDELDTR